jgi:hypothetical protein
MAFVFESKGQHHEHKWILGYEGATYDIYYDTSSIRLAEVSSTGIDKDTTISIIILQIQRISLKYEQLHSRGRITPDMKMEIYISDRNARKYDPWIPSKEKYQSFEDIPFRYILAYGPRENPLFVFGSNIMRTNNEVYEIIRNKVLQKIRNVN